MAHEWTSDDVAELQRLRADGLSAGAIANVLGRRGVKVSRSAVIGKLHRLGVSRQIRIVTRAERTKIAARRKIRPTRREGRFLARLQSLSERLLMSPPPDLVLVNDEVPPGATSLLDTHEHQCRWPYGDSDYKFCPRDKVPGLHYCEAHARRAYYVPEPGRVYPVIHHVEKVREPV